jgi:hypothetical protein
MGPDGLDVEGIAKQSGRSSGLLRMPGQAGGPAQQADDEGVLHRKLLQLHRIGCGNNSCTF